MARYSLEELLGMDDSQLDWLANAGKLSFADGTMIRAVQAGLMPANIGVSVSKDEEHDFCGEPEIGDRPRPEPPQARTASIVAERSESFIEHVICEAEAEGLLEPPPTELE